MLRNIFSFHIHSAQSSNTKFCCKLRSSDREVSLFWRLGKWIFQNWISQIFMMCAWSWIHIFRNEMRIFNVWVSSNCSKNGESSGVRGLYISSKLSKNLSRKFLHMYFLRFLVQQNTALFSTFRPFVRPSVRHRRDISTFLDILTVYTMKTIYFLNAYHLGW